MVEGRPAAVAYVLRHGRPQIRTRLEKQHRPLSPLAQSACQDTTSRTAAHDDDIPFLQHWSALGCRWMFWLNRKTLSGSYVRLTSASRAVWRIPATRSWCRRTESS